MVRRSAGQRPGAASARGEPVERLRRQAVERLDGQLEVLRPACPRASCARGRGGSGRRPSRSARPPATPRRRRAAGPDGSRCDAAGDLADRLLGELDQRVVEEDRLDPPDATPSRPRCRSSAAKRSAASRASASSRASSPASRWRWSSSCSAVSTTEVTIPGRQTTPPEVQTAPPPTSAAIVADLERELGGAGERVPALVHRRRAGVGRLAVPRDPRALDAERAEHDAERKIERLEHRALLDVQLEVGAGAGELRARLERAVELDAVLAAARPAARPRRGRCSCAQLVLVAHRAGRRRRAEERAAEARALLVGPVDEPDGDRRRRPRRRSAAAPRRRPGRSGSRRASRRSAPSRCGRRSAAAGRRAAPASVNHWLPASSISSTAPVGATLLAQPRRAPRSHVSVHATRWAPFSSPVSSRSSSSSATVRADRAA